MFVENLHQNQILDFLKTCDDYKYVSKVTFAIPKKMQCNGIIIFTLTFSKEPKNSISKVVTATDTEIFFRKNENWIKYLFTIFGEEYKIWYKNKQEEEFKRIFENE